MAKGVGEMRSILLKFVVLMFVAVANAGLQRATWDVPDTIYAASGIECNIYFAAAFDTDSPQAYTFEACCDVGVCQNERWTWTPTESDSGSRHSLVLKAWSDFGPLQSVTTAVVVAKAPNDRHRPVTFALLGDSLTNARYQDQILAAMKKAGWTNFRPVGSRTGSSSERWGVFREGEAAHDGYGGFQPGSFLSRYAVAVDEIDNLQSEAEREQLAAFGENIPAGQDWRRGLLKSPLVRLDGERKVVDVKMWLNRINGGNAPDYLFIELGINGTCAVPLSELAEYCEKVQVADMRKLIACIRAVAPKTVIALGSCLIGGDQDSHGKNYGCAVSAVQMHRNMHYLNTRWRALVRELKAGGDERVFFIPFGLALDPVHGYLCETVPAFRHSSEKVVRMSNACHPNKEGGRQLGDAVAAFLRCDLSASGSADAVLPEGDAPEALTAAYFPDRVHEFVWRNWNVVEIAQIAKVLRTSAENVVAMAQSMGLPPATPVPPEIKARGYISIIRRNWHLLPYSQLLELLDMTPERLSFSLREEDFLWIKLGSLKPKCEPLRYSPPDGAARRRADEIRRVVENDFGELLRLPVEPRFGFVRKLSSPMTGFEAPASMDGSVSLRFVYSYLAVFGDPLSDSGIDPYPDGFLQRLSSVGVNGVWLHVVLRDLAPGGVNFPEFGEGHVARLANLRSLVARAKRYGVNVYLYMNEPRAMPNEFFKRHPHLAGVGDAGGDRPGVPDAKGGGLTALCTSCPEVRRWMSDALAYVFREVPGLGGIYAITASENLTNCASHGKWKDCKRCRSRGDADIIAEVVATLEEGVHRSSPAAKVIVSDWGWRGHGDAQEIISRLPKGVVLMSVSEWDLPVERGGIKSKVGEYSISAVGPGPRAQRHWDAAALAGIKCAAEIQFNNTCELPVVPYLPVMDLVAEHLGNLSPRKLDGMLIGWTMGGHPSPNFELARRMNTARPPAVGALLDQMAHERFGADGGPHARRAWTLLSEAYRQYPYHIRVIYTSPVTWGAANPLYPVKSGYKATMWGFPYDDLDGWRGPYPREVLASQFEKMASGWMHGVEELRKAVDAASPDRRDEVRADLRYARAAGVTFRSVANQARFAIARDRLAKGGSGLPSAERQRLKKDVRRILEEEIRLAQEQYALVCEDSRIGFEPSCQYFYMPLDLLEKVVNCRWLQAQFAD